MWLLTVFLNTFQAQTKRVQFSHVHLYMDFFFLIPNTTVLYNPDLVESLNVKFKDQHRYKGPTLKLHSDFLLCKGSVPLTEILFKDHQYYISFSAVVLTFLATDLCCDMLGFVPHNRR